MIQYATTPPPYNKALVEVSDMQKIDVGVFLKNVYSG